MINLLVFLLSTVVIRTSTQQYASVPTSYGVVQGKTVDYGNNLGSTYYGQAMVFLGIPYAQAPTGDLRFEPPQPCQPYNNVYDATYYRPMCPQANAGTYVNEDCLYLNVFTQQTGNSSASAAVMVFIDGSNGLSSGGTGESDTKGTVRNLVTRGVVVVTIQYRLGALGFMTTNSSTIPPNLGMLDQVMALQWVNTQISNFGGNPNQVTLVGHGDGACAVDAHTLSPMSQNLFQQAILSSGTIQSCYAPETVVYPPQQPQQQQQNNMPVLNYDPGAPQIPLQQGQSSNQQYQQSNQYPGSAGGNYNQYPNQNQTQQGANTNYNQNPNQNQYQNQNSNQYSGQNPNQNQYPNQNSGTTSSYNPNSNMAQSNGYNGANAAYPNSQPSTGYNGANAAYDQAYASPSQAMAQQLCNITPQMWASGQFGDLKPCLKNYSVDFFVKTQGNTTATWMIVRDNQFLPDSLANLQAKRPPIPIIIGTVQDEDADYAFKLIANGAASSENPSDIYDNWMFSYAEQKHLNQSTANQCANIISQGYNITPMYDPSYNQQSQIGNANLQPQYQQPNYQNQQPTYTNQGTYQGSTNPTPNNQSPPYTNQQYQPTNQGYSNQNSNQGYGNQNTNQGYGNQPNQQQPQQNQPSQQGSQNTGSTQYQQSTYYYGVQGGTTQQNPNAAITQYQNQPGQYQNQQGPYQTQPNQQQTQPNQYQNQPNQQQNQQNQYQNQPNQYQNQQGQQNNGQYQPTTGSNQNTNQNYANVQYDPSRQNGQQYQGGATQQPNQQGTPGPLNYQSPADTNGRVIQPMPGSMSPNPQPQNAQQQTVTNVQTVQALQTVSTVSADSGIMSQSASAIEALVQNGNQQVLVYQFTYVSQVGRQNVPQTQGWQPVFRGQDQYFLFMSETVWTQSTPNPQDLQVANQMGAQWTQFAKTGTISNWTPTNTNNYNYCNLNTQPTTQSGYASQARQVFNDQVNPIVQQAQNDYMVQTYGPSYSTAPQPTTNQQYQPQPQPYYQTQSITQNQYAPAPYTYNGPANVEYSQNGDSSDFHMSFTLSNYSMPVMGRK